MLFDYWFSNYLFFFCKNWRHGQQHFVATGNCSTCVYVCPIVNEVSLIKFEWMAIVSWVGSTNIPYSFDEDQFVTKHLKMVAFRYFERGTHITVVYGTLASFGLWVECKLWSENHWLSQSQWTLYCGFSLANQVGCITLRRFYLYGGSARVKVPTTKSQNNDNVDWLLRRSHSVSVCVLRWRLKINGRV